MKTTLNTHDITNALLNDKHANWSYNGAKALAEYLEQIEEDCDTEIEFDRVAIRCEYSEFSSLLKCAEYYLTAERIAEVLEDSEEGDDEVLRDYIRDHGQFIEFDGGIIVSSF